MSKITCIIIEDEPLATKVLSDYIAEIEFLELKATFRDAVSATGYLRDNLIHLIFLDIHLPRLKGIAFLKTLMNRPAVIITTAYHQYAVDGFEMNVTDYLLKPFEFERFLTAVTKVKTLRNEANTNLERTEFKDSMFVNIHKKKVRILFSEIVYIESQKEYVRINTTKTRMEPCCAIQKPSLNPANLIESSASTKRMPAPNEAMNQTRRSEATILRLDFQ